MDGQRKGGDAVAAVYTLGLVGVGTALVVSTAIPSEGFAFRPLLR
ncbi:MAG: hypothetical protein R2774_12755 [Saprospiraceae bacterium]